MSKVPLVLTPEDSKRVADAAVEELENSKIYRYQDHLVYSDRAKEELEIRRENELAYRRHVMECNWHNRINTLAIIVAVLLIVKLGLV